MTQPAVQRNGRTNWLWFVRRLLLAVVVVWAAVTLLFVMFFVAPGDRVDQIMGGERMLTDQARAATSEKLGLDEPVHVQYVRYWQNLLSGDIGTSYVTDRQVSEVLANKAPSSLRLAFWALAVEVAVGVGTGIYVGSRNKRISNGAATLTAGVLLAMPVFVIGFLFQLLFGILPFQNDWPEWMRLPVQGIGPDSWVLGVIPSGDQWKYLLLPAVTLGLISGAVAHRLTREAMHNAMDTDFVRGARARGVSERRVIIRHGLRNAIAPIVAFLGVDLVTLFGSAIVTEQVFNWPGVGNEMASAVGRADAPVVLGITIVLALAYVFVNLLVDLVHRRLDPRTEEAIG